MRRGQECQEGDEEVHGELWCGFTVSGYNPMMYCHQTKNIITLVHGDDFVSSVHLEGLDWLHDKKKRFKVSDKGIVAGASEDERGPQSCHPCELLWMRVRG